MADDDEATRSWWQHPAVIGATITGVLGLAGVAISQVHDDGGGSSQVRGVEAALSSDVGTFHTRCPTTITFDGTISATGGSGEVAYRFVHIDTFGGVEQEDDLQRVTFDGAGSVPVRHEWTPTVPQGEVVRTASIQVVSPVSARSNDVTVVGTCDASLPEGPSTPPPDVSPPG